MGDVLVTETRNKLRALPPMVLRPLLKLPASHADLLALEQPPTELLGRLRAVDLVPEQAVFLGYALPEREAVWWACMCVRHSAPPAMTAADAHALDVSEDWVRKPEQSKHMVAQAAAKAAGSMSAAAFVARAVFGARLAAPTSTWAGRLIEGAIRRAAACDRPEQTTARLRRFIASAEDIAAGGAGRLPREPDARS